MNKEKDFFKTCFNTVAGLEVRNESQAIAKEVVLSEIENLQQENKQLKMIVNEYERLNKGFKITNVQEYNIDELLSYKKYKDNWNYVKKMLKEAKQEKFNVNGYYGTCTDVDIDFLLNKMQELEQGSDNNDTNR